MLLLIYVLITTYFIIVSMSYDFFLTIKWEVDVYYYTSSTYNQTQLFKSTMIQLAFIINCMIAMLMTFFLKFHIYLVSTNKTTIENLDKKGAKYKSVYDIGFLNNWY